MSKENVQLLMAEFEQNKLMDGGEECWSARTLCELLGYKDWDNFQNAIKKAKEACITGGGDEHIHFRDATEIVMSGVAHKPKADVRLTRWGAYLVAMNGDVRKERIAFAQVYFVARTQQAEVIEQRLLLHDRVAARRELAMSEADFSKAMCDANLSGKEIAEVRARGDKALLGKSTEDMKRHYGMLDKKGNPSKDPLGDRLPTVVQRGKAFAAELTKGQIEKGLRAVRPIAKAHEGHNTDVRNIMLKAGITPESLPPGEDTKKLERQIQKEEKEAQKVLGARRQLAMKAPTVISDSHLEGLPLNTPDLGTPLPFED